MTRVASRLSVSLDGGAPAPACLDNRMVDTE